MRLDPKTEVLLFVADELALDVRTAAISTPRGTFTLTPARRRAAVKLAVELYGRLDIRACVGCACTDAMACEGGCSWATRSRCTRCAPRRKARRG